MTDEDPNDVNTWRMSARMARFMRENGVKGIADVLRKGRLGWYRTHGLGKLTLQEICDFVMEQGREFPEQPEEFRAPTKWRHKTRGSTYLETGRAELQSKNSVPEGAILVVYRGQDGKLWARPDYEFEDGRFEKI